MERFWLFLNIALDVYPFIFLQYLPFKSKLKLGYKKTMLVCAIVMLVHFLGFVWLARQPYYTGGVMLAYRFMSLAFLLALTAIFMRGSFAQAFFVFGLMAPYVIFTITAGSYVSFYLRSATSPPTMVTSLCRLAIIAASFPVAYCLVQKHLVPAMRIGNNRMWWYALPVPAIFTLVSLFFVSTDYEEKGVTLPVLLGMLFILLGCCFACYFLLKALRQLQEKTELEARERQGRQLLAVQQEQYARLAKNIESTKLARHDLRHHLHAIAGFLHNQQYKELEDYVKSYENTLQDKQVLTVSNHPAVNSVASHYLLLAEEKGVEVSFHLPLASAVHVEDIDLCVLVGNAMENAMEACENVEPGQRFIRVRAEVLGDKISFICDNSFDGILLREGEELLSRKRGGAEKGTGLSSIMAVAQKYGGMVKTDVTADTFMLSVLL